LIQLLDQQQHEFVFFCSKKIYYKNISKDSFQGKEIKLTRLAIRKKILTKKKRKGM
jgi:hypothetical protein